MKKVVFRSFFIVLVLMAIFHNKAVAVEAASAPAEQSVISVKLPVYRSFDELSDYRIHLAPGYVRFAELKLNDKVTVLSEKDYAAQIKMADGRTGWVHKAYLSSDPSKQTWLVKEWRNLRNAPGTTGTTIIGKIPDRANVTVLDYDTATNFYKVQTADGTQTGWIYGTYQWEKDGQFIDNQGGSNVIPYDFSAAGTVTNKITIFTPLNTKANVTANQLNQFIFYKTKGAQTLMTGMGSTYLEAQNVTGLNAVYLLAHSGLESKWGTSDIVKAKNNFYGIGAVDLRPAEGAYNYSTPKNGIVAGAIYINRTYVNRSPVENFPFPQPTLDNMRFNSNLHQYSTDEAWAGKIAQIAKEFSDFTASTGWKNLDGKWYYFNSDWTLKTGWLPSGGKWYYFDKSGIMKTGWQSISGKWYYLNPGGDMKTGWVSSGSRWYFMNASGVMQTGWVQISRKWYYFYSDGHMAAGTTIGGYRLGRDGAMIK